MISFSTRIFTETKCQVSLVVKYIRTTDVNPINFSISLIERKAVEDYKGVLDFGHQPLPRI